MRLSHRDQLIALGAVALIVALAAIFLLIIPKFQQASKLDNEISQARADIQEAKTLLDRRQDAKKEAASTENQLLRIANSIPDSPELPSLIIELQDAANDSGVDFAKMSPQEELTNEDGYQTATVDIGVVGRWADLVHFFQKVNKIDRQLRIVSIVVAPATTTASDSASSGGEAVTDDDEPVLAADLTVEVYTMGSGEGTDAAPAPPPGSTSN